MGSIRLVRYDRYWVRTLVFLVASSFFVFSSFARLLLSLLVTDCAMGLQLLSKMTRERRWFPW